uniref:UPF0328 protein ECU06_0020/ n=1 Tax=Rhabditophanes sp. KR3021 TaxID=114890 RepID=A0AC35UCE0_9BILA
MSKVAGKNGLSLRKNDTNKVVGAEAKIGGRKNTTTCTETPKKRARTVVDENRDAASSARKLTLRSASKKIESPPAKISVPNSPVARGTAAKRVSTIRKTKAKKEVEAALVPPTKQYTSFGSQCGTSLMSADYTAEEQEDDMFEDEPSHKYYISQLNDLVEKENELKEVKWGLDMRIDDLRETLKDLESRTLSD